MAAAVAAAAAAAAAAGSSSDGGVFVEEGKFSEREVEVAAILAGLQSVLRARFGGQRLRRPEIPSWGRRRRRTVQAAGKPVAAAAAGDSRGEGAASPDTPLAFPDEGQEDDDNDEEREDEAAAVKKARAHEEWVQEQRGVVASLSHENAHLLKIEEFRARLQSSRSTNDSLKKIQSKHKKRPQREENDEEEARKRKLPAHAGAAADRPALGLDLNEPVAEAEPVVAAQWCHHRGQMSQHKAALTAAARRRRQLIRRAKAAARRAGRGA